MSETKSKNSKTEIVIAIDDEDESEDIADSEVIEGINESVSQTLELLLDSIEAKDSVDNKMSAKLSDEEDNGNDGSVRIEDLSYGSALKPIHEMEDPNELEVNLYYNESRDSENDILFDDMDDEDLDLEGEDCMVIDDMSTKLENSIERRVDRKTSEDSEDIEFIEELNSGAKTEHKVEEVIELSDDEEDCLIIDDSISSKQNKVIVFGRRLNAPIYSSDSFIPLSQPSTSSASGRTLGLGEASTSSSGAYSSRTLRSTSTPLRDLFSRPLETSFGASSRVSSSSIRGSRDEPNRVDDSIPFLYSEEPKPSTSDNSNIEDIDLISECVKLDRNVVQNVLDLIEDQCTVPFIVRYRQPNIFGIDAEKVRRINAIYHDLKTARERAKEVETTLRKQNRINPQLSAALKRCRNLFEVEHLYRLCRNESELSEKYRNMGLGESAIAVLEGKRLDPNHFVNRFAVELDSEEAVKKGWFAIIADIISKDCDVLEFLIAAYKQHIPTLQVVENKERIDELKSEPNPRNKELIEKYLRFRQFKKPIDRINAHSYMAIERGEGIGILNVYIEFETIILNKLIDYCALKWNRCITQFLVNSVRISFNNQLKPSLEDYIRWELRHSAHMTALDVFRNNAKHLLLEPPLRGEMVIGIDPGLTSGFKLAVVSPWGVPLECKIVKLDDKAGVGQTAQILKDLMLSFGCTIIALGNGTGCRRFESFLLQKISSNFFEPINVKYKIINESGVSYYSVTNEAKADLPHFPPNMIGAISIARRLIDPLSELVKVDPRHLQVGMYMRDIEEELVRKAFHEVAVECVSFCGVDVNVCSVELLSKVAGLGSTIAQMIVNKRVRDGLFTSRSQLKNIDGIGWKQFEQCAGFIKIMPSTSHTNYGLYSRITSKKLDNECSDKRLATSTDDFDLLDSTIIHPESYSSANTYIELIGADKEEIGKQSIRNKIKNYDSYGLPEIAQLCNTHPSNMKLIIEGLSNSVDFDYRINFQQIYIPDIQTFNELSEGKQLKGRVTNVTPMGAFIDCGIVGGINAFLSANECQRHSISVNDNVFVKITSIVKRLQRFKVSVIQVFKNNVKFL